MPSETIVVSEVIPVTRDRLYADWLSSDAHSSFTGDRAKMATRLGGRYSTLGGYASGTNVELVPGERIVQTWRSSDFPSAAPDSRVEIGFEETLGGTLLTIQHTDIPAGQAAACADAWIRHYFEPMLRHYESPSNGARAAVKTKKKAAAKPKARAKAPRKGGAKAKPKASAKATRPGRKATKPAAKVAAKAKPKLVRTRKRR